MNLKILSWYKENCRNEEKTSLQLCYAGGERLRYIGIRKLHELTKDIKPDAKCAGFVNDLDSFRNAATASSPQELIRNIYDRISADELLSVGDDPATRQANLELLVSYAREYSDYKDGGTLGDLIFNLEI